jgi:peroxiredoxin
MALAVGQQAPDFALPSTSGQEVRLSDFAGRQNVLLAFFPAAFTSVCTAELCAFSEDFARFQATGTAVLPVSVDAIPSLKAYKAAERLTVDLLADVFRRVTRAYDVLDEKWNAAKRAYFLIDRAGTVRWMHVEAGAGNRRQDDELLAEIAKL